MSSIENETNDGGIAADCVAGPGSTGIRTKALTAHAEKSRLVRTDILYEVKSVDKIQNGRKRLESAERTKRRMKKGESSKYSYHHAHDGFPALARAKQLE